MSPLLSPLRYLTIRHGWWVRYNLVFPGIGGICLAAVAVASPARGLVFGGAGLLNALEPLLAIVGGFFVAALTLVTSDRSDVLKAPVGGQNPPRLKGEVLSRRRFLAFLFGYLAFSSFALLGVSVLSTLLAAIAKAWLSESLLAIVENTGAAFVGGWLAHIAITTLLGLYYFTERLQVSDRRVRMGKSSETHQKDKAAPDAAG